MNELKYVELATINPPTAALRGVDEDTEQFLGLVDSIKEQGVINPISVREVADGQYMVVDGLQRFTASKRAGLKEIPCHVLNLDEMGVAIAQYMSNSHRVETKLAEYAKHIVRILALDPTLTVPSLAAKLCKTPTTLYNVMKLMDLSGQAKELVNAGKIIASNAYVLARMPVEEQENWLERAMTQAPSEFAEPANARIKEIKEAKRQGKAAKPEEFVPTPRIRSMSDIGREIEEPKLAIVLTRELPDALAGFIMGLKYAIRMDPESVREAKEKDEVRRAKDAEEKAKRKVERDAKKAADAKNDIAKLES